MDDVEQARAYSGADFDGPHHAFVERFRQRFGQFADRPFQAVDLGCEPAAVTVRFALAHPAATVMGEDGSAAMLTLGRRRRIAAAGLDSRVKLLERHLPDDEVDGMRFDVVLSNGLLHHLWRS
jgi:trans-aconitate methyltransferase